MRQPEQAPENTQLSDLEKCEQRGTRGFAVTCVGLVAVLASFGQQSSPEVAYGLATAGCALVGVGGTATIYNALRATELEQPTETE